MNIKIDASQKDKKTNRIKAEEQKIQKNIALFLSNNSDIKQHKHSMVTTDIRSSMPTLVEITRSSKTKNFPLF